MGTTLAAGFIFALGPGHNIPLLGGTPALGKGLALMAAVIVASALVLVAGHAWLARLGQGNRLIQHG